MGGELTLLDGVAETRVEALVDGDRVLLTPAELERATGWEHKPEGLCRDGLCVPLRDPSAQRDGRLDLALVAAALQRPVALDLAERAVALGTAAPDRGEQLASLRAPDFALPDLDGRMHTLSAQRGKKVLLVAYASW
jgi:hypothetical protein